MMHWLCFVDHGVNVAPTWFAYAVFYGVLLAAWKPRDPDGDES